MTPMTDLMQSRAALVVQLLTERERVRGREVLEATGFNRNQWAAVREVMRERGWLVMEGQRSSAVYTLGRVPESMSTAPKPQPTGFRDQVADLLDVAVARARSLEKSAGVCGDHHLRIMLEVQAHAAKVEAEAYRTVLQLHKANT